MFFIRFAALTCGIYLVATLLLEAVALAITYWKGGLMIAVSLRVYGPLFTIVWLLSFGIAWRIFLHWVRVPLVR